MHFKTEPGDHSPGKKHGGTGLASEKAEAFYMQNL